MNTKLKANSGYDVSPADNFTGYFDVAIAQNPCHVPLIIEL
jgi:hypothetical protein